MCGQQVGRTQNVGQCIANELFHASSSSSSSSSQSQSLFCDLLRDGKSLILVYNCCNELCLIWKRKIIRPNWQFGTDMAYKAYRVSYRVVKQFACSSEFFVTLHRVNQDCNFGFLSAMPSQTRISGTTLGAKRSLIRRLLEDKTYHSRWDKCKFYLKDGSYCGLRAQQ